MSNRLCVFCALSGLVAAPAVIAETPAGPATPPVIEGSSGPHGYFAEPVVDSALLEVVECPEPAMSSDKATIFTAAKIITMDPMAPEATAVATLGGRILALGTLDEVKTRVGDMAHEVVTDYAEDYLYPGFIESHAHAQSAGLEWMTLYLGQMEQMTPDGVMDSGVQTVEELTARVAVGAQGLDDGQWLFGWGYDPTIMGQDITVADLDPVTGDTPFFILDASMHQAYVNSAVLTIAGFDDGPLPSGVIVDDDGNPTGRLEELEVLKEVFTHFPPLTRERVVEAQWTFARLSNRMGVTTIADMNWGMLPFGYKAAMQTACDPDFPVRLSAYALIDVIKDPRVAERGGFELVRELQKRNNDKFRIAGVKFVLDGSNQGGTGVFEWPYYYDGRPNGVYNYDPEQLEKDLVQLYQLGIQPTIHTNADGALQVALMAIKGALRQHPVPDHRTTLQHVQVANDEQFKTMHRLGVSPNFLINHIYYWGDDWLSSIGGPVKGAIINATASAKRNGLRFAIHSDHPVTPLDRLLAMWAATNRKSIDGTPVGLSERISTHDALKAITIDAAFLLGEEFDKGSVTIGKLADFTILDRDILAMDAEALREANILATVVGGVVHPVPTE